METSFTSPGLFIIDLCLYIFPTFWQVIPDMYKSTTFLPTDLPLYLYCSPPRWNIYSCTYWRSLNERSHSPLPQGCLNIVQMTCQNIKVTKPTKATFRCTVWKCRLWFTRPCPDAYGVLSVNCVIQIIQLFSKSWPLAYLRNTWKIDAPL